MRHRERQNLFAVLQKAGWKIKGAGAAELLGVKLRPDTKTEGKCSEFLLDQRGKGALSLSFDDQCGLVN
jgi:hypothetical protein